MTIQREAFILEYQIAMKNKNYRFMDWMAEQIEKFDKEEKIREAKRNKLAEIEFLMGDSSIPYQMLEIARKEIIGGLM